MLFGPACLSPKESLRTHSRPLRPLALGEKVFLQNQQGPCPNKWDRSGVVVESPSHDQYRVKVDGSGRLTLRNRRFLWAYTPATPHTHTQQQPNTPVPPLRFSGCQPLPIIPKVITQHTEDGPCDAAPPTSLPPDTVQPSEPPTTAAPSGHSTKGDNVPASVTMDAPPPVPESAPTLLQRARPSRTRKPPKRFEPETGRWIE